MLICVPLILAARFQFKFKGVMDYVHRLEKSLPDTKGVVHYESLEYDRLAVWNAAFEGHRTGLTSRVAIAVELFLPDCIERLDDKSLSKPMKNTIIKPDMGGNPRNPVAEQVCCLT